jgi:Family of unknown function (DUF5931)/Bacterial regulatory proteins, luxR family
MVSPVDDKPAEAFEVPLWRALAVYRLAALVYASVLVARNFRSYAHPVVAWVVIAVMVPWNRTVQNHVQNTLNKLQLHNRVELVRYAIEQGLDDES